MKANFYRRFLAYILDIAILSFILSIISTFIFSNNATDLLREELNIILEQFRAGEILFDVFINRSLQISYDINYQMIGYNITQFTIYVLYFIIFQFKNGGKTIGKSIMKIKVVKNDSLEVPSMDDFIKRSLLIHSILLSMITLTAILIFSKDIYLIIDMLFSTIQLIISNIILFMILFNKHGRGLHDLFANTKVILEKGE